MSKLTSRNIKYPEVDPLNFGLLTKSLNTLNRLRTLGKEQVIKACIACVTYDDKILVSKAELLRAITEGLECPMPPILPQV